jgi:Tol biopolymer transport system component
MRRLLRTVSLSILVFGLSLCCREEGTSKIGTPEKPAPSLQSLKARAEFSGRIIFQSDLSGDNEIYLLTGGGLRQLTDNSWDDTYPRWSPDGKEVLFSANPAGNYDLFVMDESGGNVTRLTSSAEDDLDGAWAPDGRSVVFTKRAQKARGGRPSLWIMDLATQKERRAIPDFSGTAILPDLSPAAALLAFTGKRTLGWDVFVYNLDSQRPSGSTEGGKSCRPRFSPDGHKIVYVSHESDRKGDIWTMNPDGSDRRRITVRDKTYDYFPSWSPDKQQIVFCSNLKSAYADKGDWGLYLVNVEDGSVALLFDSPGRDVFPDWR